VSTSHEKLNQGRDKKITREPRVQCGHQIQRSCLSSLASIPFGVPRQRMGGRDASPGPRLNRIAAALAANGPADTAFDPGTRGRVPLP
jgi:hypothetical protein